MNKIARKVTKGIAQRWVQGQGIDKTLIEDYDKTLKGLFLDGVSNISNTKLREELQDHVYSYLKYLKRCIAKCGCDASKCPSVQEGQSSSNGSKPLVAEQDSRKLCVTALMKTLKTVPTDNIDQLVQTFDDGMTLLSEEKHGLSWLTLFDRLIVVSDKQGIRKLLNIYLSKLAPEVDKCLNDHKIKRAQKLHDNLKCCFTVLMTRRIQNLQENKTARAKIKDLIASLMSLYLDLGSLINGDETDKETVGFMSYILTEFGASCHDVLLQQTADSSSPVIVQFAGYCLKTVPVLNDCAQYLRYILCVSKFKKQHPLIFEKARSVRAPLNFLDWLGYQNSELTAQMPDDRKFKGRQITNFLLTESSEELNSQLLDVLTVDIYSVPEHTQKDEAGKALQTTSLISYIDTQPAVGESLEKDFMETSFFVDRKGKKTAEKMMGIDKDQESESIAALSLTEQPSEGYDHDNTDDMEVYEVDLTSLIPEAGQITDSSTPQMQSKTEKGKKSSKKQKGQKNVSPVKKMEQVSDLTDDQTDLEVAEKTAAMSLLSEQTTKTSSHDDHAYMEVDLTSESDQADESIIKKVKKSSRKKTNKSADAVRVDFSTDGDDIRILSKHSSLKTKQLMKKKTTNKTQQAKDYRDDIIAAADEVEIHEVDPESEVEQVVSSSTVDTSVLPQRKMVPQNQNQEQSLSPAGNSCDSITLHFTSDDEDDLTFTHLISKISDNIVSPVKSPSANKSRPAHSVKKRPQHVEDLEVLEVKSDSDSDSDSDVIFVVESSSVSRLSPRKRKQNKNVENGISPQNVRKPINDGDFTNRDTINLSSDPDGSWVLKLDETEVTSSDTKKVTHDDLVASSENRSRKLKNLAQSSVSKLNVVLLDDDTENSTNHSPFISRKDTEKVETMPVSFRTRSIVHGNQTSCVLSKIEPEMENKSKYSPKRGTKPDIVEQKSPKLGSPPSSVVSSTVCLDSKGQRTRLRSHSGDASDIVTTSPKVKSPQSKYLSSPSKSNDLAKTRTHSPSKSCDLPKAEINLTSSSEGSPQRKSPRSKGKHLAKTVKTPPPGNKLSPDKKIDYSSEYSPKNINVQRDSPKKEAIKEEEARESDEGAARKSISRKRTSPDSKDRSYSLRNRISASFSTPQPQTKRRVNEETPTKKARVFDFKDDSPMHKDNKKQSASSRKSSSASEVQPRRYSLRTRRKADS